MKTRRVLSARQKSDSLGRKEETERETELAGEIAKRRDSWEPTVEILQTCEKKGRARSVPIPISSGQPGKCRK